MRNRTGSEVGSRGAGEQGGAGEVVLNPSLKNPPLSRFIAALRGRQAAGDTRDTRHFSENNVLEKPPSWGTGKRKPGDKERG